MTLNMGTDRAIRVTVAVGIGVFILLGRSSGPVALAGGLLAVVLVATSLFGSCPIYLPFGFSTRRTPAQPM